MSFAELSHQKYAYLAEIIWVMSCEKGAQLMHWEKKKQAVFVKH